MTKSTPKRLSAKIKAVDRAFTLKSLGVSPKKRQTNNTNAGKRKKKK